VSKNALSLIGAAAVEDEARGQWPSEAAKTLESPLPIAVAAHLEFPVARDPNLDVVPLFQLERFDNRRR
jgi:hypothetical protein